MFNLEYIDTKSGNWLVCSGTDYINPFSLLEDVKNRLISLNITTPVEILFDLYPTNRDTSNRFVKICFDGKNFLRNTFSIVPKSHLDAELLEIQEEKMKFF
mgnify:CR=1 FL=1